MQGDDTVPAALGTHPATDSPSAGAALVRRARFSAASHPRPLARRPRAIVHIPRRQSPFSAAEKNSPLHALCLPGRVLALVRSLVYAREGDGTRRKRERREPSPRAAQFISETAISRPACERAPPLCRPRRVGGPLDLLGRQLGLMTRRQTHSSSSLHHAS